MTEQPEALRLAEIYESSDRKYRVVAAELRRQHARIAELEAELEHASQWRDLALQFDNHRLHAKWHIQHLINSGCGDAEIEHANDFLSAPPLPGEKVLAERIAELAASQPAAQGVDSQRLSFVLDHVLRGGGIEDALIALLHDADGFPLTRARALQAIDEAIAAQAKQAEALQTARNGGCGCCSNACADRADGCRFVHENPSAADMAAAQAKQEGK